MSNTMNEVLHPDLEWGRDKAFPHAPDYWSRAQAEEAAARAGLSLGEGHWEAIRGLQAYFARHPEPHLRELYDALDEHFHARGGTKYLYTLFPGGPVNQGCVIAGLEVPGGVLHSAGDAVR